MLKLWIKNHITDHSLSGFSHLYDGTCTFNVPPIAATSANTAQSWDVCLLLALQRTVRALFLALHIIHGCKEQPQSLWRVHNTHHLTTLCLGLPGWASTRKVKPIWILLKQETVSGSGISWAICKSAPLSRQITTPVPHHSVFYRPGALPAAQPTASKHWRQYYIITYWLICINTEIILGWLGWPKWKRAMPLYLKLLWHFSFLWQIFTLKK